MSSIKIWIGILLLIGGLGCQRQKPAIGPSEVVYVLASPSMQTRFQSVIDTTFHYGIRTPEFEPFFSTRWIEINRIGDLAAFRNIIVLADLNEKSMGRTVAAALLPADQLELASSDSVYIFALEDRWAKDQMVVLIAGRDTDRMIQNINEQKGWIYSKFDRLYQKYHIAHLYQRGEQPKLARVLWDSYGWTMRIQHDYLVLREYPDKKFVWLGRGFPYRWLSVSWDDGIRTDWLTANGLFNKRQEIGQLYQDIATDTRYLGFKMTRLGEWEALKMTGLWYHEKETLGGPFFSYAFYDSRTDRTFVIDGLIFAPGQKIINLFRQVEMMAGTFTTLAPRKR